MSEKTKCICGKTSCVNTRCENIRKLNKIFKAALTQAMTDFERFLKDEAIQNRGLAYVIMDASDVVTDVYYFADSLKDCVSEVTLGETTTIKTIAKAVKYDANVRKRKLFDPTIRAKIAIFKLLANNVLETSVELKSRSSECSSFERGYLQPSITVGQFSHDFFRLDNEGSGLSVEVHEDDDPRGVARLHRNYFECTKKSYSTLLCRARKTISNAVCQRKSCPSKFFQCDKGRLTTPDESGFQNEDLIRPKTTTMFNNLEKRSAHSGKQYSRCSQLWTPEYFAMGVVKSTRTTSSCNSSKSESSLNSFWQRLCCWK